VQCAVGKYINNPLYRVAVVYVRMYNGSVWGGVVVGLVFAAREHVGGTQPGGPAKGKSDSARAGGVVVVQALRARRRAC